MKVYISGPMTGIKDLNYPAFFAAEDHLKSLGFQVGNPAKTPKQNSWEDYMKIDLMEMLECDAVAVLPGWEKSRGARVEVQLARTLKIPVRGVDRIVGHKSGSLLEKEACLN